MLGFSTKLLFANQIDLDILSLYGWKSVFLLQSVTAAKTPAKLGGFSFAQCG